MSEESAPKKEWVGDGTEGSEVTTSDGGQVTAKSASKNTPYNVRYSTGDSAGAAAPPASKFSVKIEELDGNVSVGLVTNDEFQSGWKTRGMFYNGNVTNGSAAKITNFGKYVKAGDTVGVIVTKKEDNAKTAEVQFVINGKNLGLAYKLDEENGASKVFFPCVHVSGTCKFTYKEEVEEKDAAAAAPKGFEGDWKLAKLDMDGNVIEFDTDEYPIIISLQGDPKPTKISVKVANTMNSSIEVKGGEGNALDVEIKGPMSSTMMMPSPPLDRIEPVIGETIPKMTKMTLDVEGSKLTLTDGSGSTFTTSRHTKIFEPCTKYL